MTAWVERDNLASQLMESRAQRDALRGRKTSGEFRASHNLSPRKRKAMGPESGQSSTQLKIVDFESPVGSIISAHDSFFPQLGFSTQVLTNGL